MASAWELLILPFVALGRLVKLLVLPAAIGTAAWWLFGAESTVFAIVAVLCAGWALALLHLWRLQLHGRLRSMGRGSVRVSRKGK